MDRAGKIMNLTHIQQRIDTAANWTSDNPVLYEGEIGFESQAENGGKVQPPREKVGDGKTAWNNLPYRDGGDSGSGFKTYVTADTTIDAGGEHVFNYPSSEKILTQVYEVSDGGAHDNNNIAFDDESKYNVQDNSMTSIDSGKVQLTGGLDDNTKLLLNFNNNFNDSSLSNQKTITNNGVTFDSTNYKFGGYSACFDGNSYLTTSESTDFDIKNGDFTIDWWMKTTTTTFITIVRSDDYNWPNSTGWKICYNCANSNMLELLHVPLSYRFACFPNLHDGIWHHVELVRNGDNLYWFVDGKKQISEYLNSDNSHLPAPKYVPYAGTTKFFRVGYGISGDSLGYIGNIDSFRLSNVARHTADFTPPNAEYYQCPVNKPDYVSTTDASNYSLSSVTQINSLTIPVTTPANTSVKILTSFDGRKTWLYHDSTGWHSFGTVSAEWTASNSNTELQTYFTNLSMAQLASDLGYTPGTIDFIFQLETADSAVTPVVSALTMNYSTVGGLECADVGSYDDTCSRYGLKITSPTQLSIKNKDTASHTVCAYITPLDNITYLD